MTKVLTLMLFLTAQVDGDGASQPDAPTTTAKQSQPDDSKAVDSKTAKKSDNSKSANPPIQPSLDADDSSADAETEAEEGMFDSGAVGLFREGGHFMWPILLLAIIAGGVIIERYRSLKMLKTGSSEVRAKVHSLLADDRIEDALEYCNTEQGPVPAILSSGLRKFLVMRRLKYDPAKVEEQVVKAMDDYSVHIVAALERHLPILATVSSVAPMLGFLGTVAGMVVAFGDIESNEAGLAIVKVAAGGLKISLLTTCFGLIVGIPAFMAFNYFTSVINRFVLEVEESATELIEAVTLELALEGNQTDPSDNGSSQVERSETESEVMHGAEP